MGTEIGPNLKTSANELIASLKPFTEPELLKIASTQVTIDAASEPALSANYKVVTEQTVNIKVIANGVETTSTTRMDAARAGMLDTLQNLKAYGNMIMLI